MWGSRRFHELKHKDLSLAYPFAKSFDIQVKGVVYFIKFLEPWNLSMNIDVFYVAMVNWT